MKRVVVQVRPNGAGPEHWPHRLTWWNDIEPPVALLVFEWVTITVEFIEPEARAPGDDEGDDPYAYTVIGWTADVDQSHAVDWKHAGQIVDLWFELQEESETPWTWEFRLLALQSPVQGD